MAPILFIGIVGIDIGTFLPWDDPTTWIPVVVALLLPVFAVVISVQTARTLERLRQRKRAVMGEADALPVSSLIPEVGASAQPRKVADWPLSVWWQATAYTRASAGLMAGQAVMLVAVDVLLVIVGALIIFALFSPQYSARVRAVPTIMLALVIAAPFVFTPLLVLLARMLPTLFGRRFGVAADDGGLTGADQYGDHRRLRWDEVRLLEISVAKRGLGKRPLGFAYTAYGARDQIEWRDNYAGELNRDFEPVGMTTVEAQLQARRLLALAMTRTGLPLRTLDPTLQAPVAHRAATSATPSATHE